MARIYQYKDSDEDAASPDLPDWYLTGYLVQ